MKKKLSLAAALAVLLSLAGCSASDKDAALNGGTGIDGARPAGGYSYADIGGSPAGSVKGEEGYGEFEFAADMAAPEMAGGAYVTEGSGGMVGENGYAQPSPQSGLLTGGEWNDNAHWADWKALYDSNSSWSGYKSDWRIKAVNRLAVKVENENGEPVEGAEVTVSNWMKAVTDNKGMAYLFGEDEPSDVTVRGNGAIAVSNSYSWSERGAYKDMTEKVTLEGSASAVSKKLDLMIMCDTTGSMSDELEYLKAELADIVKKIKSNNANIPTRVSVNFYRDEGDEYVVRQFPFTDNIDNAVQSISEQSADGGGDFPEAVHTALDSAVNNHDWNEDSVKIMFLVLDAPPHSDAQIVDSVNAYVKKAAEMGIRIIPIASSGIDKSTEYLLRTMAFTTGGTYTFLTSDSGIGGDHIDPTVGAFNVEKLGDMMVRIVNGYLE